MVSPLISVDELATVIGDADLRIVDCRWYLLEPERGLAEYGRGHIPGAVYASLDDHLSGAVGPGRHPLPDPTTFARAMASLGITRGDHVVAYDDRGGAIAARLWWMLVTQGFEWARVLDGGIPAWVAAGHPLVASVSDPVTVEPFDARTWTGVVGIDAVADRANDAIVLDARAPDRYAGDEEPVDPRAGHIPGARSLPLTDLLDAEGHVLSPTDLRGRFSRAGVDADTATIAQCGSGVTACHLILGAVVAGLPPPDLYVGSWSDWASTDRPVATGPTP